MANSGNAIKYSSFVFKGHYCLYRESNPGSSGFNFPRSDIYDDHAKLPEASFLETEPSKCVMLDRKDATLAEESLILSVKQEHVLKVF